MYPSLGAALPVRKWNAVKTPSVELQGNTCVVYTTNPAEDIWGVLTRVFGVPANIVHRIYGMHEYRQRRLGTAPQRNSEFSKAPSGRQIVGCGEVALNHQGSFPQARRLNYEQLALFRSDV
jgi:hypothetical protein